MNATTPSDIIIQVNGRFQTEIQLKGKIEDCVIVPGKFINIVTDHSGDGRADPLSIQPIITLSQTLFAKFIRLFSDRERRILRVINRYLIKECPVQNGLHRLYVCRAHLHLKRAGEMKTVLKKLRIFDGEPNWISDVLPDRQVFAFVKFMADWSLENGCVLDGSVAETAFLLALFQKRIVIPEGKRTIMHWGIRSR
jgi:hypothetical protein